MSLRYILDDYDVSEFLRVASAFGMDRFGYVVTPNVDHLIRFHDEPSFRSAYADAAYVLLDSRFLSYVFRIAKAVRIRVCTGSDLTEQLFGLVVKPDDPIVLIGGNDEQAQRLRVRYGLKSLHHLNPPMGFVHQRAEVDKCVKFIEAHSPFKFCFLAVGAPQQELLAQQLLSRGIARGMAFCIGASINFLTGVEKRAPLWMQNIGMEWLYRLANDPSRLARRYLVRGPRVFALVPNTELQVRPRPISPMSRASAAGTRSSELV